MLNQNIQTFRKENGSKTNIESSSSISPTGGWVTVYDNKKDEAIHSEQNYSDPGLSFYAKLSAYYQFKIKRKDYAAFVYRNFALKDRLPWWGLGISVIL